MRENEIFWQEIVSEIDKELENITRLREELEDVMKNTAKANNRRLQGSILHDFYNCCERVFRRVTADINGGFRQAETWYKGLLYRMTIEIKGIRPQVISEDLAAELDDYLSFRHVVRNIYGFELKGERLDRLVAKFDRVSRSFSKQITEFLRKMEKQ
jgi:predicted ribosome quality control (RQC) complex YloA/Tae2 family protein